MMGIAGGYQLQNKNFGSTLSNALTNPFTSIESNPDLSMKKGKR